MAVINANHGNNAGDIADIHELCRAQGKIHHAECNVRSHTCITLAYHPESVLCYMPSVAWAYRLSRGHTTPEYAAGLSSVLNFGVWRYQLRQCHTVSSDSGSFLRTRYGIPRTDIAHARANDGHPVQVRTPNGRRSTDLVYSCAMSHTDLAYHAMVPDAQSSPEPCQACIRQYSRPYRFGSRNQRL
eukprot:334210-Rhodomonas_salina.6